MDLNEINAAARQIIISPFNASQSIVKNLSKNKSSFKNDSRRYKSAEKRSSDSESDQYEDVLRSCKVIKKESNIDNKKRSNNSKVNIRFENKFEKLPTDALEHIIEYLDDNNKLNVISAFKRFVTLKLKKKKNRNYLCFFFQQFSGSFLQFRHVLEQFQS